MIYKCGCVENAYWCDEHDIYSGNTPPWGRAGSRRCEESKEVSEDEWMDDRQPTCCSCHLSAPCGFCEGQNND